MPAAWNVSLLFRSKKKADEPCVLVCLCVWNRAHGRSRVSIYKFFDELLRIFISAQFHILEIPEFFWLLLKLSHCESCTWRSRTHFSNQFTFFLLMHMKWDPNYQITLSNQDDMQASARCEAVGNLFFLWDCLHRKETFLFLLQSSWANDFWFVLQLTQYGMIYWKHWPVCFDVVSSL